MKNKTDFEYDLHTFTCVCCVYFQFPTLSLAYNLNVLFYKFETSFCLRTYY